MFFFLSSFPSKGNVFDPDDGAFHRSVLTLVNGIAKSAKVRQNFGLTSTAVEHTPREQKLERLWV